MLTVALCCAALVLLWPLHVPPSPAWAEPFTDALLDARLSRQDAAAALGISEPQLSRALADVPGANIHLKRIANLPPAFHQWYGLRLLTRFGLPAQYEQMARAALLVLIGGTPKHMAGMALPGAREERVS